MSAWPTDEAREAVTHMSCVNIGCPGPHDPRHGPDGPRIARKKADRILAALAPHVAALVRAERAAALREAAAGFRENAEKMRARGGYSAGTSAPRHQMCDEVADVLEHEARRIERGGSDA